MIYFFFLATGFLAGTFFAGAIFFAGALLYSLYSALMHVYASNADTAVIRPAINPFEKTANNKIAATNTTVYPKFLDNTFNNLSNILFPSFCSDVIIITYFYLSALRKNTVERRYCRIIANHLLSIKIQNRQNQYTFISILYEQFVHVLSLIVTRFYYGC